MHGSRFEVFSSDMVAVILLISFRVTHRYWAKHTLFPVSVTQSCIIWALPKFITYFPLKLFNSEITFQYKVLCTAILHVRFATCGTIQTPPMKMFNSIVLILHSVNAGKWAPYRRGSCYKSSSSLMDVNVLTAIDFKWRGKTPES